MNIEIKVQEYFEELRLMEKQYGLEEELYPFINMLLRNGNETKNLSIRTVAKGVGCKTEKGRALLYGCASFPDLAILSRAFDKDKNEDNLNKIYGCVEAKPINGQSLLISEDMEIAVEVNYRYIFEIKPSEKKPHYWYSMELESKSRDEKIVAKFGKSQLSCCCNKQKIEIEKAQEDKIEILIINNEWEKKIEIIDGSEWKLNKNEKYKHKDLCNVLKQKAYISIQRIPVIRVANEIFSLIKEDGEKGTDAAQLFGELFWYGKVLYTNGLVWKYLEMTECIDDKGNKINLREKLHKRCIDKKEKWYDVIHDEKLAITIKCKTICDLRECYKNYKELQNNNYDNGKVFCNREYAKSQENEFVSKEWDKLIKGLEKISWTNDNTIKESGI